VTKDLTISLQTQYREPHDTILSQLGFMVHEIKTTQKKKAILCENILFVCGYTRGSVWENTLDSFIENSDMHCDEQRIWGTFVISGS
jgi:hypothetical protein